MADGGGYLDQIEKALNEVHQAAADGHITIWGRHSGASVYQEIIRAFWLGNTLDFLSILNPNLGAETKTERLDARGGAIYQDLRISSAQFEAEWPSEGKTYPKVL